MLTLAEIARVLRGQVSGRQVLAPGPGHSHRDRSLSVRLSEDAFARALGYSDREDLDARGLGPSGDYAVRIGPAVAALCGRTAADPEPTPAEVILACAAAFDAATYPVPTDVRTKLSAWAAAHTVTLR